MRMLSDPSHLQFLNWLHNCSNKNLEGRGILRLQMSCYLNVRFLADQVSSEVGLNEDGGLYLCESSREGERRAWAVVCVCTHIMGGDKNVCCKYQLNPTYCVAHSSLTKGISSNTMSSRPEW